MTPECFDALKNPIPCTVVTVTVPEPGAWELVIAVVCLAGFWLATWRLRRRR